MESYVKVSHLKNGHCTISVYFTKVNVTNTDSNAAFMVSTFRFAVQSRVVIERLTAVRLLLAPVGIWIG